MTSNKDIDTYSGKWGYRKLLNEVYEPKSIDMNTRRSTRTNNKSKYRICT